MIQRIRNFLYSHEFFFEMSCRLRSLAVCYGLIPVLSGIRCAPVKLLVCLFILLPWCVYVGIRLPFDRRRRAEQQREDAVGNFEHELVLVTCVRNEAEYMAEWVTYHHMVGFSKILVYDNGSDDNLVDVLAAFVQRGIVEIIDFPGECKQVAAFTDAISRVKEIARYAAFMDADEFILTCNAGESLSEVIKDILQQHPCASGVAVGWMMFGSSHHKTKPDGLVTDVYRYRACADYMRNIKTIGNPRLMHSFRSPHYPHYLYDGYNVDENGRVIYGSLNYHKSVSRLRINHYFTKSEAECMAKIAKGIATVGKPRTKRIFTERDRNDVYDDTILYYLPELKKKLNTFSH